MRKSSITVNGVPIPVIVLDTAVVGSGCAGLNAADWLHDFGRRDIALLTEGMNMGTSRNTGSDKQTYYKLSLCGGEADSVADMARDLFSGGGVNGDTALAEAAGSVRGFMKLCNLGVPFPTNEYGEYVGYKTDHDPRRRATSAGPLTSRMMTECLEKSVRSKGIPILDGMMAVRLLVVGRDEVDDAGGDGAGAHGERAFRTDGGGAGELCAGEVVGGTGEHGTVDAGVGECDSRDGGTGGHGTAGIDIGGCNACGHIGSGGIKPLRVEGLLCLDKSALDSPSHGITLICARQIILATGGPAGCYLRSVYPESQTGMSGLALEAGAAGVNLHEWQYGLASLKFRWNVSGTYQQVLPRYISVDDRGVEREFLPAYFADPAKALDMVFLKGYQWPFDSDKLSGSSLIDVLVHHETETLRRRVYMDFRRNPSAIEEGFDRLSEETRQYLSRSGALYGTPIERLEIMNRPAIDLYRRHGIDLYTQPLEIGVCAQHHNGGIAVDADWQSTIRGLYVTGEAAGTFGTKRPGGSALNSTQVGSLRAAEHIACTTQPMKEITEVFGDMAAREAEALLKQLGKCIGRGETTGPWEANQPGNQSDPYAERLEISALMSRVAGHMRDRAGMAALEDRLRGKLSRFFESSRIKAACDLPDLLKNRDIFITQLALLSAMGLAADSLGSRGSALVMGEEGTPAAEGLAARFVPGLPQRGNLLITTERAGGGFESRFEPVRPLPVPEDWFESVWRDYRERIGKRGMYYETGGGQ